MSDDEAMRAVLRLAGYEVRIADAGDDAAASAAAWAPTFMVQDGFTVARYVRGRRHVVPAVFLSPGDRLSRELPGLTVGGGSYLAKPFSPDELIASARAVLRRARPESADQRDDGVLRFADLELHEDSYDVLRAGKPIVLSLTEFRLLRYLMHNADKVLTRAQILDHVWPYDFTGNEQLVDAYVLKLRRNWIGQARGSSIPCVGSATA
ncbi:two-component system OmpR family response regulator [Pseudonocardia eucalypti]|uniref:response regulator transcription factor n=1 Tax=Pseudonocardia eucalypti TaxID=648755 RepID=UPI001832CDD9|nr:two-component system OmpR family response regulator [Pseudonocardia eucalypti]